jgi:hypothetical protein
MYDSSVFECMDGSVLECMTAVCLTFDRVFICRVLEPLQINSA